MRNFLNTLMSLKFTYRLAFPVAMIVIMIATLAKYNRIQDFRSRSFEHRITVEASDIDSLELAIRKATFQDVDHEKLSENRYKIIVRCPPDNLGSIFGLIQRLGGKRSDE